MPNLSNVTLILGFKKWHILSFPYIFISFFHVSNTERVVTVWRVGIEICITKYKNPFTHLSINTLFGSGALSGKMLLCPAGLGKVLR